MRSKFGFLVVCSAAGLLAGCGSQSSSESPAASADVAKVEVARDIPATRVDSTGSLTLSPGALDGCSAGEGGAIVEVSWDSKPVGGGDVAVYWEVPGGQRQLWVKAGEVGADRTGPWVINGSKVTLARASDDAELASLTVEEVSCT